MTNNNHTKLITAKQVQEEYLPIDIRRVRKFLSENCKMRKIGSQYFYIRQEVEQKLIYAEGDVIYHSRPNIRRR